MKKRIPIILACILVLLLIIVALLLPDKISREDAIIQKAAEYQSKGNFTKAEATLMAAIEQAPSAALYTALSQTYVAQDKLSDAAQLLNRIADPELYRQMQALRPEMVTASLPSGIYNENLSPTFTCPDGKIHLSYHEGHSLLEGKADNVPHPLTTGDHLFWLVAVNDAGLVSSPAIFHYTITAVAEEVFFADPVLESMVRQQLSIAESAALRTDMLWQIQELTISSDVTTCDDFVYFPNLCKLTMTGQSVTDSNLWLQLPALQALHLSDCELGNQQLLFLSELPYLQDLSIINCNISNISPLSNATALTHLDLSGNLLNTVEPLAKHPSLQHLVLHDNEALTSISPLLTCPNLKMVEACNTKIASVEEAFAESGITVKLH